VKKPILVFGLIASAAVLVAARPTIGSLQGQINQLFALVVGLRADVDANTADVDSNGAAIEANRDLLCDLIADNRLVAPVGLDCGGRQTADVNVVCSNNVTADVSDLAYELSVTPLGPVVDGVPVDFAVDGVALFPPSFMNAALATIPGLTELTLTSLNSTVVVRSGATGPDVPLTADVALPAQVAIPLETDPISCGAAGLPTPCVLEPLVLPLAEQIVTLTPSGPGGEILFGWDESRFPPISIVLGSPGPVSTRVTAVVLQIGLECGMGTIDDNGTPSDESDDFLRPLTDAELVSIPIAP
jgi:hypothetical protein